MKDMTVIGFGVIGKSYTKLFAQDFRVGIFSSRDITAKAQELGANQVHDFEEAVSASDYVFSAVPLASLGEVVERINHCVRAEAFVFDACSAKVAAMSPKMFKFTGEAKVYDGEQKAVESIHRNEVSHGDIVVIRYEGPKGGPGM